MNTDRLRWYGDFQKFIRGSAIFCCFVAWLIIIDDNIFLNFTTRLSQIDYNLHETLFSNTAEKLTPYIYNVTNILLVMAIILLFVAGLYIRDNRRLGYGLQLTGLLVCVFSGVFYIGAHYLMTFSALKTDLYCNILCIPLILCALATLQNLIFFIRRYKNFEKAPLPQVIGFIILIICCLTGCSVYLTKNIGADYKIANSTFQLIENHSEEHPADIAYQYGNVSSRTTTYHDGYIYSISDDSVYKVDALGNVETIYTLSDGEFSYIGIYYHQGYIYGVVRDFKNVFTGTLVRISEDTGACETISIDKTVEYFGIVDDRLYYSVDFQDTKTTSIYYLELNKPLTLDNEVLYDENIGMSNLDPYEWFSHFLYNATYMRAYFSSRPQYIGDNCYCLIDWSDSYFTDGEYFSKYSYAYSKNAYCTLEMYVPDNTDVGYSHSSILEYVVAFNVFNNTIYYAQETDSGYDILSCDKDGNNTTLISSIPVDFEKDDYRNIVSLYVAEDFIWCRIELNKNEILNYTISAYDGTINEFTLQ